MKTKRADEMPANLTPELDKRHAIGDKAQLLAAEQYVERVAHTSDFHDALAWHGWALREAFLAGCSHAAASGSAPYPPPEPADGCGQCAGMVSQCREARYCACYRVPFEAGAAARRAHERATPPSEG